MLATAQLMSLKTDMGVRALSGLDDVAVMKAYNTPSSTEGTTSFRRKKEDFFKVLVQTGDYFTIKSAIATNAVASLFMDALLSNAIYAHGIDMADPDAVAQCQALVTAGKMSKANTMDVMVAMCTRNKTPAETLFGWEKTEVPQKITHQDVGKARLS